MIGRRLGALRKFSGIVWLAQTAYPGDVAANRRPASPGTIPPSVLESPLNAFQIGADVRAMQDQVAEQNIRIAAPMSTY